MFDEYSSEKDLEKWPGAKRAIDESLKKFGIKPSSLLKSRQIDKFYLVKE